MGLIIIFVIIISVCHIVMTDEIFNNIIPNGRSFSVKSSISANFNETTPACDTETCNHYNQMSLLVKLHEEYSIDQKRARIKINAIKNNNYNEGGLFLYDEPKKASILLGRRNDCYKSNLYEFYQLISYNLLPQLDDDHDNNILFNNNGSYLSGPAARLIYFVQKNFDNFELKTEGSETFDSKKIKNIQHRNIPCLQYSGEFKSREKNYIVKINLFYAISSKLDDINFNELLSKQLNGKNLLLPLKITIDFVNSRHLIFEFWDLTVQYDQENVEEEIISSVNINRNNIQLDKFAFKLSDNCLTALKSSLKEENLFKSSSNFMKFSFRANIDHLNSNYYDNNTSSLQSMKSELFVAYDGATNSLRIDYLNNKFGLYQIYNFRSSSAYFVYDFNTNINNEKNSSFILNINDKPNLSPNNNYDNKNNCFMSRISSNLNKRLKSFDLGELLAGENRFVYMGLASVRGQRVKVFMSNSGSVPFWLDQRVDIKTLKDEIKTRSPEKGGFINDDGKELFDKFVTIIIYIKEEKDSKNENKNDNYNKKIVHLDIIRQKHNTIESIYDNDSIDVFEFDWNLQLESLDGLSRGNNLFSLQDLCYSHRKTNENGLIEMLLDLKEEGEEKLSKSNFLLSIRKNSFSRNFILLSSLQEDLSISINMIQDIQSKFVYDKKSHDDNNNNLIYTKYLVSSHTNDLVEIIFLSRGQLLDGIKSIKKFDFIYSFQACYLLATQSKINIAFAYDQSLRSCIIDLNPISHYRYINEPAIFKLVNKSYFTNNELTTNYRDDISLEIYRIEHKLADEIDLFSMSLNRFTNNTNELQSQYLDKKIKLVDPDTNLRYYFEIKKFTFESIDKDKGINKINGYDFLEGSRIEISSEWHMTYDLCHSICISNFEECQTFSFCLHNFKSICSISNTTYHTNEIINELNKQERVSGQIVTIVLENQYTVKLIKNPKCVMYKKLYLDLFSSKMDVEFKTLNGNDNDKDNYKLVKNLDACAELCVKENIGQNSTIRISNQEELDRLGENESKNNQVLPKERLCISISFIDNIKIKHILGNDNMKKFSQIDNNNNDGICLLGYLYYDKLNQNYNNAVTITNKSDNNLKDDTNFKTTISSLGPLPFELRLFNLDFFQFAVNGTIFEPSCVYESKNYRHFVDFESHYNLLKEKGIIAINKEVKYYKYIVMEERFKLKTFGCTILILLSIVFGLIIGITLGAKLFLVKNNSHSTTLQRLSVINITSCD